MPNDSNLVPKSPGTGITQKPDPRKPGLPPLWARAQKAAKEERQNAVDASSLPNRLGLMLDCSGSMGVFEGVANDESKTRMQLLQQAYDGFTAALNLSDTAVACCSFPGAGEDEEDGRHSVPDMPLTNNVSLIAMHCMLLKATGGTPMQSAMDRMLSKNPITRGVLISDGGETGSSNARHAAEKYKAAEIPIDCIHIGASGHGEDLLADIARITGGIYIKFTDVEAFAKAFDYLTPAKRHLMLSGAVGALELGATEVRR